MEKSLFLLHLSARRWALLREKSWVTAARGLLEGEGHSARTAGAAARTRPSCASAGLCGLMSEQRSQPWVLACAGPAACALRPARFCVPAQSHLRVQAVTTCIYIPLFLSCCIVTVYHSGSWKRSTHTQGRQLPLSGLSGKLCILQNVCPLVRSSLPAGGKV